MDKFGACNAYTSHQYKRQAIPLPSVITTDWVDLIMQMSSSPVCKHTPLALSILIWAENVFTTGAGAKLSYVSSLQSQCHFHE